MVLAKTDGVLRPRGAVFGARNRQGVRRANRRSSDSPQRLHKKEHRPPPRFPHKNVRVRRPPRRDAHTEWFVEEKFGRKGRPRAVQDIHGRTHQIRVHMSDLGFPIMGDYTYKFQKNKFREIEPPARVMLHARRLRLPHPVRKGEEIDVSAPAAGRLQKACPTLRETYGFEG